VAASFVQSKADVLFIRRVLDEAGGKQVKIISKIENAEGLHNFDEILEVTDGIMVARGDLGMEIPVEKVPLAQKVMITKANISGKFIITATQMMESMITNPIPTRAELTDVANAVFDGTDCVMLSGESANGSYPDVAVSTMANICRSAEIGVNLYQTFDYIRSFTPKPISAIEAIVCSIAKNAVDLRPGMIIVFSEHGKTARLLAKYRPCAPVLLVTSNVKLARSCATLFAMYPFLLDAPINSVDEIEGHVEKALNYSVEAGLCMAGKEVIVFTSTSVAAAACAAGDEGKAMLQREVLITLAPGQLDHNALGALAPHTSAQDPRMITKTITLRSTVINLDMLTDDNPPVRKTKLAVTIGPASSTPEILERLVDSGMDIARFKFSHGTPQSHAEVLGTLKEICKRKGRSVATLMDLQGPEVRTSYLIDKQSGVRIDSIELKAGDKVSLYGTDNLSPDSFVGYRDFDGSVRLGVDLPDLADVARAGNVIRLRDGAIGINVTEVSAGRAVVGVVINNGIMGERKVLHISGVTLHASPSSTYQDMQTIQDFAMQHGIDFVAASQVGGRHDVEDLRRFLDDIGAENVKIIAKIETREGLRHMDDIIEAADGIMIARGNLGMAIPPEKVALAQCKVLTKAKVAGKPVIVARHMLESMNTNPRPTRAEMTDVANAVLDSADCVMLCSETASGMFPVDSVVTASRICRNAEHAMNYAMIHSFIRDFSAKPFNTVEAAAVAMAKTCMDAQLAVAVVISDSGEAANVITKYRPSVPLVVVTSKPTVQAQCNLCFGQRGLLVEVEAIQGETEPLIKRAVDWARQSGLFTGSQRAAIMHGTDTADTEKSAILNIIDV